MNESSQDTISATTDPTPGARDDAQERQADATADAVFGGEERAADTAGLIRQFVASYERHKDDMALDRWLIAEFAKYPSIWQDEAEIAATAREVIASVEQANAAKESLYADLDRGRSREAWLAKRIEVGAAASGVSQVGVYAEALEREITTANQRAYETIMTKPDALTGTLKVNENPHLHGLLAETEVANRFNLDAQAGHAGVQAETVGSYGYNSPDLILRDAAGNELQQVQLKSYNNVDQAIVNIRGHDYPAGTTLLVHEDQVERLQREFPNLKVTSTLEAGGVSTEMPSYEDLKRMQTEAQTLGEAQQYEWNDVNRIAITKGIGKQALIAAGCMAGWQGARILGRRVWNRLAGRENPPASEELKDFFASSLKTGAHLGARVAVSGAIVVAVKNGWLSQVLKATPAGQIANIVYLGMENAKVVYKFSQGEVSAVEALDAMGNVTASLVGGCYGAGLGIAQGAAFGTVLGPVGALVGGFVGGVVGGLAGTKVAEALYSGGKVLARSALNAIETLREGVKDAARAVAQVLNPLRWLA
jgi:hypothetical protein